MQNPMRDPAAGVPPQLLQHLHLVSKYRYPSVSMLSIETVVNYLLEAPKIVRDVQPMHWTFLDAPADGTVLLIWQPLDYLGTGSATDGYIWADPEQAFNHDAKGYTLEMYMHRSGFHPPNDSVASHSRKRYRLTPGKVPIPGQPPCDPSLWLIHYTKAERRDHYPVTSIPVQPQIQNSLRERAFLQRQGLLTRKDFMLHDKANWPTITLPGQQSAAPGMPAQQAGFGRGSSVGPVPPRAQGRPGRGSISMVEPTIDEEEDVSRGDMLDFLTPREISRMRYEQHHEWMEEIMGSPYSISQIVPVELGLGRKGALETLTNGFFTAPTSATYEAADGAPPRVGRMEEDRAKEFKDKAEEKLASMRAEIEKMKKEHARKMSILQKSSLYTSAERRLRNAVEDPNSTTNEALRLEKSRPGQDVSTGPPDKIADIVAEVESSTNKMAVPLKDVNLLEKGGLEEKEPEPTPQPEPAAVSPQPSAPTQDDVHMSATTEEEVPAIEQSKGLSPTSQQPTTSASPVPAVAAAHPAPDTSASTAPPPVPDPGNVQNTGLEEATSDMRAGLDVDVDMGGLDEPNPTDNNVDDWVMVNDDAPTTTTSPADGSTAPETAQPQTATSAPTEAPAQATKTNISSPSFHNTPGSGIQGLNSPVASSTEPTSSTLPTQAQPESKPETITAIDATTSAAQVTQPSPVPAQQPANSTSPLPNDPATTASDFSLPVADSNDPDNFESLNTAGEAMEGYDLSGSGQEAEGAHDVGHDDVGNIGEDDLDLGDLDNSAFGEAFHHPDD